MMFEFDRYHRVRMLHQMVKMLITQTNVLFEDWHERLEFERLLTKANNTLTKKENEAMARCEALMGGDEHENSF